VPGKDPMTGPQTTCPRCGADLVLEMDPVSPPDDRAIALLADPPYRYVCPSPSCS